MRENSSRRCTSTWNPFNSKPSFDRYSKPIPDVLFWIIFMAVGWLSEPVFAFAEEDKRPVVDLPTEPQEARKFSAGIGLSFPDIIPISLGYRIRDWVDFNLFVVPQLPFNIYVEYGRGVLANRGGLSIENPDLRIRFKGLYGPQYGGEFHFRPWRGSFFTTLGLAKRSIELKGSLTSNVILTSTAGSIDTNSQIFLSAKAKAEQLVYRASFGWRWKLLKDRAYLSLGMGIHHPQQTLSNASIIANIFNPAATTEILNEAIENAERKFEDDLKVQTKNSMKPLEDLSLPYLSITTGVYF